jgi:rhodanese-related sulfurtransferase
VTSPAPTWRWNRARAPPTSFAPCTSACSRCPTRSRSGPGTSAARFAAAPASTSRPPRRSASSATTTGRWRSPARSEFVENAVASIGERPPNVEHIVALNRGPLVESISSPARLTPRRFEAAIAAGACAVDSRTNEQFDEAHIPGAISASAYDTGFATKVAQVVPPEGEVVVVAASDGNEQDAAELLAAVGLKVRGFLGGGMSAWRAEERRWSGSSRSARTSWRRCSRGGPAAGARRARRRRVRRGHIAGSLHIPYGELRGGSGSCPATGRLATICKGGKRSGLGRLGPPARGLRDDPRRPRRRRRLAGGRPPGSRPAPSPPEDTHPRLTHLWCGQSRQRLSSRRVAGYEAFGRV